MTTMNVEIGSYQHQLAYTLHKTKPELAASVIQAFDVVARHPFVDHYYTQHVENGRVWTRHEQEETPMWYEQIYQDQALVTNVDGYGRTLSSSSQPGVMASMLDALAVQPGMRVLEVGTGSGYNAALLAYLAGDPHCITSLDIDQEVTERAKHVIPQVVGKGMTILQADGSEGYRENAPYDRVIVTASSSVVPIAWMEQLAPDGVLLCILQPRFALLGGLLHAQKNGESLQGKILQTASFMELRAVEYHKRSIRIDFHAPISTATFFTPSFFQPHFLQENHHFTFFLYYDLPDLYVFQKGEALFCYRETFPEGYLVFRQKPTQQVELHGDPVIASALWNRLVRASVLWDRIGQPAITAYGFEMNLHGQALSLSTPSGIIWPFAQFA
jgi:protein-L-isoaspartate(D-aspartate) O-methyltransferase